MGGVGEGGREMVRMRQEGEGNEEGDSLPFIPRDLGNFMLPLSMWLLGL